MTKSLYTYFPLVLLILSVYSETEVYLILGYKIHTVMYETGFINLKNNKSHSTSFRLKSIRDK